MLLGTEEQLLRGARGEREGEVPAERRSSSTSHAVAWSQEGHRIVKPRTKEMLKRDAADLRRNLRSERQEVAGASALAEDTLDARSRAAESARVNVTRASRREERERERSSKAR